VTGERTAGRRRQAVALLLVVVVLPGLAGCGGRADAGPDSAGADAAGADGAVPGTQVGIVERVVDGDTIDVAGVGRIRVIGIDTPERGDCGYDSATAAMSVLVLGERVTLVPGAADDADRYDRLLRYVDVGAVDVGLSLIEDGWAIARYDSRDGYGAHPREGAYVAADLEAPDLGCYPDFEP
jgi:micrococcal nuclease